jgi:predicted DNA-binding transcriptional regulator AlpA
MSEELGLPPKRLLSRRAVARRLDISESSVKRLVRDGRLAKPRRITKQRVGWFDSDVDALIASLQEA